MWWNLQPSFGITDGGSESRLLAVAVGVFTAVLLERSSEAERGRISDSTANPIESVDAKFHRHEGVARERAFQRPRFLSGKAKPGIVLRVSEDENDPLASGS
jgi:predicted outer membrane lipoprotein